MSTSAHSFADFRTTGDISSNVEQFHIGNAADRGRLLGNIGGSSLISKKQAVIQNVKIFIGHRQATAKELELTPKWLLDDALHKC